MMRSAVRVVKVGGSLFEFGELPAALNRWLECQPPAVNVLTAGGGRMVDVIRDADSTLKLGQSNSHWICVDLLSVTARLLSAVLPGADYETCFSQLADSIEHRDESQVVVFDVARLLRDEEQYLPGITLPQNWDVTSDSIAARVAELLAADELVLLKSAAPEQNSDVQQLVDDGYVDPHFNLASESLPLVRLVNLRDSVFSELCLESEATDASKRKRPDHFA